MKTILKYLAMVRSLKYLSPEYNFILLNNKRINSSVYERNFIQHYLEEGILKQKNEMQRTLSDWLASHWVWNKGFENCPNNEKSWKCSNMTRAWLLFWVQLFPDTLERGVKLFVQYSAILSFNINFKLESASQ